MKISNLAVASVFTILTFANVHAFAQTKPAKTAEPSHVSAAPRIPVVQAPRNGVAQKTKGTKQPVAPKQASKVPAARPAHTVPHKPSKVPVAAGVAAGAVAGVAAGAAVAAPAEPPLPTPPLPAFDPSKGSTTGLAIPRFMSMRFDDVNLRVGPGTRYPIDWVYHRRDLPLEILREFDDWRLVQDQDSIRGWVRAPTLSPRRGIVVIGGEQVMHARAADEGAPVARLKVGVIGHVRACAADSQWCEVEVGTYRGWLRRDQIFGVYPNEAIGG